MSAVKRPPLSGKVGFRRQPQMSLVDAAQLVAEITQLLPEAFDEVRWMHDLAYGQRSPRETSPAAQAQAVKRDREESKDVGPPTSMAWGEVPNDLASSALANGHYRSAYRQMTECLTRMRSEALKILTLSDKAIGEARTYGSPLPDMTADKVGKVEYAALTERQRRRRERGEL